MSKKLDDTFKTVIALDKSRFNIWKVLSQYKNVDDLLVTFFDTDNDKKYACIRWDKLIEIVYGQNSSDN